MEHTIVALSTPPARAAIALVRLSGETAIAIADRVFSPYSGKPLAALSGYHAAYGDILVEQAAVDDGIALVLRAPKSYTGEDMVEISCHGNPQIAARLVAACIAAGAKPAGAGEFTRRAFSNGKIDLSQAEAVAELIEAESDLAAAAALQRRTGALGKEIGEIADLLSFTAAELTMWSDYPEEEDAPAMTAEKMAGVLSDAAERLHHFSSAYHTGRMMQNGIQVAIVGSPNVGKSTLMNRFTGSERSIVTDIAGTTRDIIEAAANLDGIALRLLDTAGIRESGDAIEQIGVARAKEALAASDLVLYLIDRTRPETAEDASLLAEIQKKPHITVLNKMDLPGAALPLPAGSVVELSAATGAGFDTLKAEMRRLLGLNLTQDSCMIASQRQFDCVVRSEQALQQALSAIAEGITLDAVGVLLDDAIAPLAELTGRKASDAVLEQVFSKFCVGK